MGVSLKWRGRGAICILVLGRRRVTQVALAASGSADLALGSQVGRVYRGEIVVTKDKLIATIVFAVRATSAIKIVVCERQCIQ